MHLDGDAISVRGTVTTVTWKVQPSSTTLVVGASLGDTWGRQR